MDEQIHTLDIEHPTIPNLLCAQGDLERALQLQKDEGHRFLPLYNARTDEPGIKEPPEEGAP